MIFPMLHLSNNLKEKKRKRKIDLAILPSHDTLSFNAKKIDLKRPAYLMKLVMLLLVRSLPLGWV